MTIMKTTTHKMTYDEYCLLPNDGKQYEIFDGELVVTPSPHRQHQRISGILYRRLADYVEERSLGEVYYSPLDTVFTEYTVLQPDILFISRERVGEIAREKIEGAPDLVVEILSPSTFHKDLRRKMKVYSESGVSEYWIVDPEMKTIELYCQGKEGLELARRFSAEENFESRLLAGFQVAVSGIFK